MNVNRLNLTSKTSSDCDLKVRICNENRLNYRPVDHRLAARRTPSPPKTTFPANHYLRQLNNGTEVRPMFKVPSQPKSCYTGCNGQNKKLPTAPVPVVEDSSSRLKKLEKSGLLAKFAHFQTTKSVPLALEEEEDDIDTNDDVFDDDIQIIEQTDNNTNNTIELKSSGEFEPKFVTQIRQEVRKLSNSSSQRTQRSKSNENVSQVREEVRKSAYVSGQCKALSQTSLRTKKSKSNDNIVEKRRDSKKEVVSGQSGRTDGTDRDCEASEVAVVQRSTRFGVRQTQR